MLTGILEKIFGTASQRAVKRVNKTIVKEINKLEPYYRRLTDKDLKKKTYKFKEYISKAVDEEDEKARLDEILIEAFALVREVARRVLLMRHFDVQLIGGVVLHQGKIAEMKTGEGKTLVATLPAYLNGLTGKGVHIVTVNDYLAQRDTNWMGPIYKFLGLTVRSIIHDMEEDERWMAYRADITYGTNNEFGFDYLRDNMKISLTHFVQRGHNYAIIDEIDSILIDEARTPLIISGPTEESTDKYYKVNRFVSRLKRGIDYNVDEKSNAVVLTEAGMKKAEQYFEIKNLYEPENSELLHHINQALKAHSLFKRDRDYIVKDGQIIIVDEFTGRLMYGRRYSDGLHQAIEAKEGVKIANENQTLATITFQNYFRMYKKLAGMTGTAMSEAEEFYQIYKLKVVEIPTNRPMIRVDYPDVIYLTAEEKFKAVVREIEQLYKQKRPVLVGTISVENSEKLAAMLRRRGIPCQVLNAKNHAKEAEIIARAGQAGSVTISTNMAGRGTDIVLGPGVIKCPRDELGNVICCIGCKKPSCKGCIKEKEKEEGKFDECFENVPCGLHIIGTERHEARRIDDQLRGRSGRQGDPGSSRFYVSLEDDLVRLFGGDRIKNLMAKIGMKPDQPIEHKLVSRTIERAQKKVEANNFGIRKYLLEYDNVMNTQREEVYKFRREVLESESVTEIILDMIRTEIELIFDDFAPPKKHPEYWDMEALKANLKYQLHYDFNLTVEECTQIDREELIEKIYNDLVNRYQENMKIYDTFRGEGEFNKFEKYILLREIDNQWKDHLHIMDHLKEGIQLRAYGQRDPLIEYKKEAFELYSDMEERVRSNVVRTLTIPIKVSESSKRVYHRDKKRAKK